MRYLRIWFAFLKMSWMADMEYRANLVVHVLGDCVWYVTQLSIFEVLFMHTNHIGIWDIHAMRVFMGTMFLVDCFFMIFWHENMEKFNNLVKKGELDLYLVKPINSQFMCTFRKIGTAYFANLVLLLSYLTWAIGRLTTEVHASQLISYVGLILCGCLVMYAIRVAFLGVQILVHSASNIGFVFFSLYRVGMRPDTLYPKFLRYFILFVVPVALISSVPARSLVEGVEWVYLVFAPLFALFLLFLSHSFWNFCLTKHSSASS